MMLLYLNIQIWKSAHQYSLETLRNTAKAILLKKQATSAILAVVIKLIAFEIDQAYLITYAMGMA